VHDRGSRCRDGGASGRVRMRMRESVTGADEGGRVVLCATGPFGRNGRMLYIIIVLLLFPRGLSFALFTINTKSVVFVYSVVTSLSY
jgi:hypothetical protein